MILPLHHIFYSFNRKTPYGWTLHVVYYLSLEIQSLPWLILFVNQLYRIIFNINARLSRLCYHHKKCKYDIFNFRTIKVWYISSIFIRINYFSFFEICNPEQYRVIVSYIPTPDRQVSVSLFIHYYIQLLPWLLLFVGRLYSILDNIGL